MDLNKDIIDAASLALVIGTLAEWLPPVAAAISIVWTCLRIHGLVERPLTMDGAIDLRLIITLGGILFSVAGAAAVGKNADQGDAGHAARSRTPAAQDRPTH